MTNSDRQHIHETPSRYSSETIWEASAETGTRKSEVGFTLQTLIVTAVLVLVAVGASLGLLAITSSSSDDFEEAGKTGVEARCAPNEIWDQEYESRGIGGPDSQGGIRSRRIGCKPYCGTWEYFSAGKNKNDEYEQADAPTALQSSIGGPDGNGGVYSQNIGCFAPCYWDYSYGIGQSRPEPPQVKNSFSRLRYFEDNHAPVINQIRLGVNYRRSVDPTASLENSPVNELMQQTDLNIAGAGSNKDGKPFIHTRGRGPGSSLGGARLVVGTQPLAPEMLAIGLPQVFEPNWRSKGTDPGPGNRENSKWEDEDWEVRADPINKECTIVNIALDDKLICSSEWDNCTPRP